ncbi:MAG: prepilin-type N-terminal cleavage/methylation domain-containing protein [Campylobacterales bacterium]|nr:prepilin-type N-terminal cleavage/methylation domain-containing protein [Campylobacterales bacterium]
MPGRAAFTMIEMIFAIVIIGIVVAGVPQMISQNAKGTEGYLKQEVIAAAAGEAFRILSYPWDDNSVDRDGKRSFVLDATSGTNLGRVVGGLPLRVGHIVPLKGSGASSGNVGRYFHRRFFNTAVAPSSASLPGTRGIDATLIDARGATGYKSTYSVALPANQNGYILDAVSIPDTGTAISFNFGDASSDTLSNMKMAAVQIDSPTQTNILTLRVYAANIGTAEYFTRGF